MKDRHLITVDELRAAGALDVPEAWKKSLGEDTNLFSETIAGHATTSPGWALGSIEESRLTKRSPNHPLSAPHSSGAIVSSVDLRAIARTESEFLAQSMAPILYARPNTVGRFTDLPILMWYEAQPTPRGRMFRYSVVFTNEDGGTATDRLMATWGRTTDIEFVYGVEVDSAGAAVREEFQGAGHQVPAFNGRHEGRQQEHGLPAGRHEHGEQPGERRPERRQRNPRQVLEVRALRKQRRVEIARREPRLQARDASPEDARLESGQCPVHAHRFESTWIARRSWSSPEDCRSLAVMERSVSGSSS